MPRQPSAQHSNISPRPSSTQEQSPSPSAGGFVVGLPAMFIALMVGPLAQRLGMAGVARAGFSLAAVGMVLEAALSQSLIGICVASLVFVAGVVLAIPAMITLFGEAAAPERAGGWPSPASSFSSVRASGH